jgi:hypothetical protein
MSIKPFFWISSTIMVLLLLVGCNSSSNGPSSAPRPETQQAAGSVTRIIVGSTADPKSHAPNPNNDDGDHCFRKDDKRDLVLTLTAPEVKAGKISATLIDLNNGPLDDKPAINPIDDTTATITFSDQGNPSPNLAKASSHIMHLGPGPYVVATTIKPATAAQNSSARRNLPIALIFPYVTYSSDPISECPILSSQAINHP